LLKLHDLGIDYQFGSFRLEVGERRLLRDGSVIPLRTKVPVRQKIGLCFLRSRERDPNLLALLAACRVYTAESA